MRSQYQDPPESGGPQGMPRLAWPRLTPAVRWLLWANVGVFLFFWFLAQVLKLGFAHAVCLGGGAPGFAPGLALSPASWREWAPLLPVWQLVTYGFLHSMVEPWHVLGNMLMLYFFGTMLEGIVGSRRFLAVYFAAMVLGGALQLVVGLAMGSTAPTLGASGAVLAVVVAMAVLRPGATVFLLFFPITLKVLALVLVGLDLFALLGGTQGSTAVVVHLTGAAFGFLAVRLGWIWRDPVQGWQDRRRDRQQELEVDDERRLDELLERIHREGMSKLTRRERDFLRRVSDRR